MVVTSTRSARSVGFADRSGRRWLRHDGRFTELMVSDARIGRVVAIGSSGRLWVWTGTTWSLCRD